MRQIDEVKKLTGGRYLVKLEGGISFPLYRKETEALDIHEEGSLSEEALEEIMRGILPKRAKLCAMHYLQSADRTEQQVRIKLETLFYPEEIIRQAISYVKSYHYIDDLRYAVNYIECHKDSRSMRQMTQELSGKGIEEDIISQAVGQTELPDEEEQIRFWLQKKHYSGSGDRKETERMYGFLLRRGYSMAAIRRVTGVMYSEDL